MLLLIGFRITHFCETANGISNENNGLLNASNIASLDSNAAQEVPSSRVASMAPCIYVYKYIYIYIIFLYMFIYICILIYEHVEGSRPWVVNSDEVRVNYP